MDVILILLAMVVVAAVELVVVKARDVARFRAAEAAGTPIPPTAGWSRLVAGVSFLVLGAVGVVSGVVLVATGAAPVLVALTFFLAMVLIGGGVPLTIVGLASRRGLTASQG